jgi:hypothetical protein
MKIFYIDLIFEKIEGYIRRGWSRDREEIRLKKFKNL